MGAASKAIRRNRRVSAINVFQQEQMKQSCSKFRIGSLEYKALQSEICNKWKRLNQEEKQYYERIAAQQTMVRKTMSAKCLADPATSSRNQSNSSTDSQPSL
jgi:hypothetical protein